MAYTENIENTSLFFRLSTVDLHWYDLQSYVLYLDKYKAANKAKCHQIVSQNLNENSHIATY
jgi:hypothetical protein